MKRTLKHTLALTAVTLFLATPAFAAPKPAVPDALRVQRTSNTSLELIWKQVKGANGYVIYRKALGDESFKKIKTLGGGLRSFYYDRELKTNKTYRHKITATALIDGVKKTSDFTYEVSARPYTKKAKIVNAGAVRLNKEGITLGLGESTTVKAKLYPAAFGSNKHKKMLSKKLFWEMRGDSAALGKGGKVTAKKVGITTLIVRTHTGRKTALKIEVVDWARPDSFDFEGIPTDFAYLLTYFKKPITDIASYFSGHPEAGSGQVYLSENGTLTIAGSLKLPEMESTIKKLLDDSSYRLEIQIGEGWIHYKIVDTTIAERIVVFSPSAAS